MNTKRLSSSDDVQHARQKPLQCIRSGQSGQRPE